MGEKLYDPRSNWKYYLSIGRCPKCHGKRFVDEGKKSCSVCREKHMEQMKIRAEQRRLEGRCPRCGKPAAEGHAQCEDCLAKAKAQRAKTRSSKKRYDSLKKDGKCVRCGISWAEPGQSYCRKCLNRRKALKKRYTPNNEKRKAIRDERKAAGLCIECGKPRLDGHVYCQKCLAARLDSSRKYSIGKRLDRIADKARRNNK